MGEQPKDESSRPADAAQALSGEIGEDRTSTDSAVESGAGADIVSEHLIEVYAETGVLYRYFASRRARLFAGYLLVVAAVGTGFGWAWTRPEAKPLAWVVAAAGCLFTLAFWALERRGRQVSFTCVEAGINLERALQLRPGQGVFSRLKELPDSEPAPGRTFDWMYLVAALGFLVGTVYSLAETML